MNGLVIKSTGSSYLVHFDDGNCLECHMKGNFRIRGIRSTNPVAVGDIVMVESLPDGTNWITDIQERRNYIIRRSTNLSKESHILAANLDQVALIVTLQHPVTSTTFIDRFLATAEAYRVPAILIFNKVDLLNEDELNQLADLRQLYESLGYPTLALSAKHLDEKSDRFAVGCQTASLSDVSNLLTNKVTLLSGNSGVGKSTLLNAIFGREMTRTGIISDAHDKGMHTTTFSEMYALGESLEDASLQFRGESLEDASLQFRGERLEDASLQVRGWVIDTPGIKGFGGVQMDKYEVGHYFREIFEVGRNCRYSDCLHTGEPECAVQEAVVQGKIAVSRYESYLSLLGDCDEQKYR